MPNFPHVTPAGAPCTGEFTPTDNIPIWIPKTGDTTPPTPNPDGKDIAITCSTCGAVGVARPTV